VPLALGSADVRWEMETRLRRRLSLVVPIIRLDTLEASARKQDIPCMLLPDRQRLITGVASGLPVVSKRGSLQPAEASYRN
jgi:hypothetical protein